MRIGIPVCTTKCSTVNDRAFAALHPSLPLPVCDLMPDQSISLREANQNFSRLMAAVERGEVFAITRRGREVARLTPSGHAAQTVPQAGATAPLPLTEAALAERLVRLEALVDKLLSALAAPDKK
ncbi:MAG: type II toxin-antitoxin system Phd/YefM family antitoxin [Polaromonas sp.]